MTLRFRVFAIFVLAPLSLGAQQECNCLEYPFRPNPPCAEMCIRALVQDRPGDIANVKNIDPGVAVHLRILATVDDPKQIDFSGISTKMDLENLSLEAISSGWVAMEAGPPQRQIFHQ